jgi:hypothetical protein
MKFKQHENGSCDVEFSWKERLIIFRKGKFHLSDENLRHFGNHLVKIVADWQFKFNEKIKNKQTYVNTEIKIDE